MHRDLKPVNNLVSNQHYSYLNDPEKIEEERKRVLIFKLTDFDEAGRMKLLPTQ